MCSIVLPRRSCTQTVDDMSDCKGLQQSMPPTRSSTRSREESSPMVSKRHESFSVEVSECAPTTKRSKVSSSWPQASSANTGTNTNIHTNMIRILILILILMLYIYIYIVLIMMIVMIIIIEIIVEQRNPWSKRQARQRGGDMTCWEAFRNN